MKVIVISGSMGAGKTIVMAEASDLLSANGIVHAAIDADNFGVVFLPGTASADFMYRNLGAVWSNFAAAGVDRLLLAEAVEHRGELDRIRMALPDAEISVCRLTARIETMRRRIRVREPGLLQEQFLARVAELNAGTGRSAGGRLFGRQRRTLSDRGRPRDASARRVVGARWPTY